jgi:hypothetical protein
VGAQLGKRRQVHRVGVAMARAGVGAGAAAHRDVGDAVGGQLALAERTAVLVPEPDDVLVRRTRALFQRDQA